jgi:hypothetical protein
MTVHKRWESPASWASWLQAKATRPIALVTLRERLRVRRHTSPHAHHTTLAISQVVNNSGMDRAFEELGVWVVNFEHNPSYVSVSALNDLVRGHMLGV